MRLKSFLSALGILCALLVSVDYVSFAATGQSVILGRVNKADDVTKVVRTTPGPALQLRTRPGTPPLKVNRTAKVAKLNADRLDGLDSSDFAKNSVVTAFEPAACQSATVGTTFAKVLDLGTFTKYADDTYLRLDVAGRYNVDAQDGNGTTFEVRVDDMPTSIGGASLVVSSSAFVQVPLAAVFDNLPAGEHTVSIWARSQSGTATGARWDPGCWSSARNVLVTEYH